MKPASNSSHSTSRTSRARPSAARKFIFVALGLLAGVACADDIGNVARARNLAATCSGCHAAEAQGSDVIPVLERVSSGELLRQLRAFRSGERAATVMRELVLGYTDDELVLIAGHFRAAENTRGNGR